MRLFVGLPFPHQARRDFLLVQKQLQKHAAKGNFTTVGNFHLTLAFLGEVEESRLSAAFAALDAAPMPPVELVFDALGCFDGGIWYLSPVPCPALMKGQARLAEALEHNGFTVEPRPCYIPHMTLGRKIVLKEGYSPPKSLSRPIPARSEGTRLFLSHRAGGELRYDILTPPQKEKG